MKNVKFYVIFIILFVVIFVCSTASNGMVSHTVAYKAANIGQLFYLKDIDLDDDKKLESVQIYSSGTDNRTGVLSVSGEKGLFEIPLKNTYEKGIGLFSKINFKDFNNDGSLDIFVSSRTKGIPYSLDNFLIYDYKSNRTIYSEEAGIDLKNFTDSFTFKYTGKGLLKVTSEKYKFHGKLSFLNKKNGKIRNTEYNNSWIQPQPVHLSNSSGLTVVSGNANANEVRATLAVFSGSKPELIGEIYLYFGVDKKFRLFIRKFELLDYGSSKLDILS